MQITITRPARAILTGAGPGEADIKTTVDIPLTQIAGFLVGATAIIAGITTLVTKTGELVTASQRAGTPPAIVLTAGDTALYRSVLSISDRNARKGTLVFFVKNRLLPGDAASLEKADVPEWPAEPAAPRGTITADPVKKPPVKDAAPAANGVAVAGGPQKPK